MRKYPCDTNNFIKDPVKAVANKFSSVTFLSKKSQNNMLYFSDTFHNDIIMIYKKGGQFPHLVSSLGN